MSLVQSVPSRLPFGALFALGCAAAPASVANLDSGGDRLLRTGSIGAIAAPSRTDAGSGQAGTLDGEVPCGWENVSSIFENHDRTRSLAVNIEVETECTKQGSIWHWKPVFNLETEVLEQETLETRTLQKDRIEAFILEPTQGLGMSCPSGGEEADDDGCCSYSISWVYMP